MAKGFSIAGSIDIDSSKANKALDNFSKGMSDFSSSFAGKVGKACENVGGSLQSFGTKLTGLGTAVGGVAVKIAADFETTMAKVSTLTSDGMYESLHDGILDMSGRLGVAANEIGEAIYQGLSSGVSEQNIQDFTEKMVKLSKGGFTSVSVATDLVTTALNAYGLEITETDHLMDVFINTQNRGKTTVDQLASSMGQVIPIASSLGVNIDQLGASYAILTANGISTSESGTKLKAMFEELGDSGSEVSKILIEQTGKSFKELTAEGKSTGDVLDILKQYANNAGVGLNELFSSSEAGSASLILAKDGAASFNEQLKGMVESSGAAADAYAKVSDTFAEKCNRLKERFKEVGIAIGENLIDIIEDKVLPAIESFADWLGNLDEEQISNIATMIEWAVKIGAVTTAIGILVKGIGGAINTLGTINSVISTLSGLFGTSATAAGGLTSAIGKISGASAAATGAGGLGGLGSFAASLPALLNPTTLAIGGVAAAIGGIGYAFYQNQKACEEGEKQFESISIAADDFTGRLKTNETIWTEIFGKEYEFHFSDSYKEDTRQIEEDFETFKSNLDTTCDEINEIMKNTNLTPGEKRQEIEEVYDEYIEKTDTKMNELTETINSDAQKVKLKKYLMEELKFPEKTADEYVKNYDKFFTDRRADAERALIEENNIYRNAKQQNRNITEEENDRIIELEKQYSEAKAEIAATNGKDILNVYDKYCTKNKLIQEEDKNNMFANEDAKVLKLREKVQEQQKIREDGAEKLKNIDKDLYLQQLSKLDDLAANDERYIQMYEKNLYSRATYDKEWADEHGINVSKILDDNGNLIGSMQEAGGKTIGVYLDNSEAAEKWAKANNYTTEEIIDQNGKMVLAIKDGSGEIIGSVIDLESVYKNNYGNIKDTISSYVTTMGGSVTDVNSSLELIKQGLANGEIDYQQYGAISEEAFLKMAEAALHNKETLDATSDSVQANYDAQRAKIHELISSSEELTKVIEDENGNQVVSYNDTMAAISQAVDDGKINISDYGATTKEEFMQMADAAIQNKDVIAGSIDGLQSVYEKYGDGVRQTVENLKAYNEDGSVNTEQTMQNISDALANGEINLESFGNVSSEEFKILAEAALNGKEKLDGVESKLGDLDKDWKVEIDTEEIEKADKKADGLWSKIKKLTGKIWKFLFGEEGSDEVSEKIDNLETKTLEINSKTITIEANSESIEDAKSVLDGINEKQNVIDQEITRLQTEQSQLEEGSSKYDEIQGKIDQLNQEKTILNTDKEQLENAIKDQEEALKKIDEINKDEIVVKTDNSNIKDTQNEEDKAQEKADDLTDTTIKPRSDAFNINELEGAEDDAQKKADDLTKTTVNPKSNTGNVENVTSSAQTAKGELDKVGNFYGAPQISTWGMSNALSTASSLWDTLWSIGNTAWSAVVNVTQRLFGNEAGTEYQNAYAVGSESVNRIKKYATGIEQMDNYSNNIVPFIAGEQGPELVAAPVGSKVYTHRATRSGNVGSNNDILNEQPIIKIYLDGKELAKSTAKYISNDMSKLSNYRKKL